MDESSLVVQDKYGKLCDDQHVTRFGRLCDLPDAVLYHILSFLPMKDVMRTSILSKRWQYLWASIPNLEFREADFPERSLFMNFVDRAFIFRDRSSVKAFSLSCTVLHDASRINAWITAAARGDLVELSLCLKNCKGLFMLPCCIFGCRTLRKLELNSSSILRYPSSACLSSLKLISLERVTFVDAGSVEQLFSSSLLEELSIKRCKWKNLKTITIAAPKLLKLSIDDFNVNQSEESVSYDREVQIHGVSLKSFYYKGSLINRYHICGSAMQLVEAEISVCHDGVEQWDLVARNAHDLLSSLSSVKSLTVNGFFLEDLANRIELVNALPRFSKLTKLRMDGPYNAVGCAAVFPLLKRSPYLKTLELFKVSDLEFDSEELLAAAPLCFRMQLKRIKIFDFHATPKELSLVEALLRTATVLEEMVLRVVVGTDKGSLSEKLMMLPRGLNCRILIVPVRRKI